MSQSPRTSCPSCRAACRSASSSRRSTSDDLIRILNDTDAILIKQYVALMGTEGVTLDFTDDAIDAIADAAVQGQLAASRTSAPAGCRR